MTAKQTLLRESKNVMFAFATFFVVPVALTLMWSLAASLCATPDDVAVLLGWALYVLLGLSLCAFVRAVVLSIRKVFK